MTVFKVVMVVLAFNVLVVGALTRRGRFPFIWRKRGNQ